MFETMYDQSGVGLAATQIDIHQRVLVVDCGGDEPRPLALINPEIIERDGTFFWAEGCLSIPGIRADVERSEHIRVQYHDAQGVEQTLGGKARLVQVVADGSAVGRKAPQDGLAAAVELEIR